MNRARLAVAVAVLAVAPAAAGPVIGGSAPAPCVSVDVAGNRAGSLDCAAARLEAAARAAQAGTDPRLAVPSATSPATTTGVASQAATRQRMGNSYGTGVRPQRPPAPVFPPRRTP